MNSRAAFRLLVLCAICARIARCDDVLSVNEAEPVTAVMSGDAEESIIVGGYGSDDPECGIAERPCRTIQYAVDKARYDSAVVLLNGTFTLNNSVVVSSSIRCAAARSAMERRRSCHQCAELCLGVLFFVDA